MADAVVHRPSLAADIAEAPLLVMVDAEAGNLQRYSNTHVLTTLLYTDAL